MVRPKRRPLLIWVYTVVPDTVMPSIVVELSYEEDQKRPLAPKLWAESLTKKPDIGVESIAWKLKGLVLVVFSSYSFALMVREQKTLQNRRNYWAAIQRMGRPLFRLP